MLFFAYKFMLFLWIRCPNFRKSRAEATKTGVRNVAFMWFRPNSSKMCLGWFYKDFLVFSTIASSFRTLGKWVVLLRAHFSSIERQYYPERLTLCWLWDRFSNVKNSSGEHKTHAPAIACCEISEREEQSSMRVWSGMRDRCWERGKKCKIEKKRR